MIKNERNIGDRCHLDNFKGTIKYIGNVPPTKDLWYGIEWDDERGKHDGVSKDGTRYFTCKPNYGSFVRPHKISFGIDEIKGLNIAYGDGRFDEDENKIILNKQTKQETFIEMVGFDKIARMQSNFETLKEIDLAGLNISHACLSSNLCKVTPNLQKLSLRDNLLTSMKEIFHIASSLTNLKVLNISENDIYDFDMCNMNISHCFPNLKSLFANKMKISWEDVQKLMCISSQLEELHLCYNQITDISYNTIFDSIIFLNLEGNQISDWKEILKLSEMKNVEKLILNDNKLEEVNLTSGAGEKLFPKLKSISLNDNLLNTWNSINEVRLIDNLEDIKFRSNPVCKDLTSFITRQEIIARIGSLTSCNSSKVAENERKNAELAYVKRYANDYYGAKSTNSYESFQKNHPRYEELIKVFEIPEEKSQSMSALKDNLLDLHFECPQSIDKPKLQKKLPATMTVLQLKGVLQRLYKVQNSKQQLSYLDEKNNREINLDDNMKQLTYYSLSSGNTVLLRW